MRRREFLLAAGAATAWAGAARAQQPGRIPSIGMLWVESAAEEEKVGLVPVFHAGLTELGYVDGRTIRVEERFADGNYERLGALAVELVRLKVDLIVTGAEGVIAASRATKTIPIVAATTADPVAEGVAASLAHPGGNLTGSAVFFPQILAKRLELLKQIAPSMQRAGMLALEDNRFIRFVFNVMAETAKTLGVELQLFLVSDAASYEAAFAKASAAGVGGFVILDLPNFVRDSAILAALALNYRLPAAGAPAYARNGGLIGYGVLFPVLFRNAASFVDKILKGAKPGDIPIEQATRFTTIVNLKPAAALGLEIPPTILAAADEVIE
jgi:putative tryptophan/tyrosine transport system substrate-binding protein